MIYATRYCSTGLVGYVYLPGPNEPYFGENNGTIIRGDADGKWHVATPTWDTLLSNAMTTRDEQAEPDMLLISGGELQHPVEITEPELLKSLSPWTGPFVDWDRPPGGGHCGWEYEVLYFKRGIKPPTPYDRGDLRMIYGLRYCIDEDGGPTASNVANQKDFTSVQASEQNLHLE